MYPSGWDRVNVNGALKNRLLSFSEMKRSESHSSSMNFLYPIFGVENITQERGENSISTRNYNELFCFMIFLNDIKRVGWFF